MERLPDNTRLLREDNARLKAENLQSNAESLRLKAENLQLKAELQWIKDQLRLSKQRRFGASSEASLRGQEAMLFNEAEAAAAPGAPEEEAEHTTCKRRKRSGQRSLLLASLPVEEIRYRLREEEQACPQCAGRLHEMGEETRDEVKIVPAQAIIVRHIRTKYACRRCQREDVSTPVKLAPMPEPAFPKSLASPSAAAYVVSQKFVEASPLYRQEQAFARLGFPVSRQTLANWVMASARWLEPACARMRAHLLEQGILHADETVLQVLKEPGRAAQTDSYIWLYCSGRAGPPIALYDYQPGRGRERPRRFLEGFRGYLHVDGYAGYGGLPGAALCGCWAHARRKFAEAVKILPEPLRSAGGAASHAGLAFCNKLFAIERQLAAGTPQERFAARAQRSKPVLAQFSLWLDANAGAAAPKTALGTAIAYCRSQWPKLNAFLEDGRLELDNNRAERCIKPFVIGRKNWLFANTPGGARASAAIYSVVETARLNGLDPRAYIQHLLERLPNTNPKDAAALDELLPWAAPMQAQFRVPARPGA